MFARAFSRQHRRLCQRLSECSIDPMLCAAPQISRSSALRGDAAATVDAHPCCDVGLRSAALRRGLGRWHLLITAYDSSPRISLRSDFGHIRDSAFGTPAACCTIGVELRSISCHNPIPESDDPCGASVTIVPDSRHGKPLTGKIAPVMSLRRGPQRKREGHHALSIGILNGRQVRGMYLADFPPHEKVICVPKSKPSGIIARNPYDNAARRANGVLCSRFKDNRASAC